MPHGAAPMTHGGPHPIHAGPPVGHPGIGPGPNRMHDPHYAGMMHTAGPHWNGYHQAYIGHHPVPLAYAGYRPSYYYHPWYHGPWRGYPWGWGWGFGPGVAFGIGGAGWGLTVGNTWGYGPYGPYGYWGYPLGWGYGGWGLGTVAYTSGYYPYYNPYYAPVVYQTVVYDYSRPIPVATQAPGGTAATAASTSPAPADPVFDAARNAFRAGDYQTALTHVDSAIAKNPSDAVYHEFRALALFARRDYRQSAAVLHSLLAVGPGWDWTTMSSLYSDPATYTQQLRGLEQYVVTNPQAADAHFVLGYHYMIGGHKDAARLQLQQVVTLMPNDRLAGELLRMVKGPPPQTTTADAALPPTPNPPANDLNSVPPADAPVAASPTELDKTLLPGNWNATRSDGSKFALTLNEDGEFRWKYSAPNQSGDEFGGTYSTDGPVLILERKEGGALAGTATFSDDEHFSFKLVGAPPDDPGLSFTR